MALGSTQPLTEMSTRSLPGVKGCQLMRLATSQPSVSRLSRKMWEPWRLTTLWVSTTCYRDSFLFIFYSILGACLCHNWTLACHDMMAMIPIIMKNNSFFPWQIHGSLRLCGNWSTKIPILSLFLSLSHNMCESIVLDLQWSSVSIHFHSLTHAKLRNSLT
jgi:hypothetical protein